MQRLVNGLSTAVLARRWRWRGLRYRVRLVEDRLVRCRARGSGLLSKGILMTHSTTLSVFTDDVFTDAELRTLAGFLGRYSGLTRYFHSRRAPQELSTWRSVSVVAVRSSAIASAVVWIAMTLHGSCVGSLAERRSASGSGRTPSSRVHHCSARRRCPAWRCARSCQPRRSTDHDALRPCPGLTRPARDLHRVYLQRRRIPLAEMSAPPSTEQARRAFGASRAAAWRTRYCVGVLWAIRT